MARWGLAWPDTWRHWLPFDSPISLAPLTIGNLGGLTDRSATRRPSPGARPGQHADRIALAADSSEGTVRLAADVAPTHHRQHPVCRSPCRPALRNGFINMRRQAARFCRCGHM